MEHKDSVVPAEWLHARLRDPDVKVLDASWYMPDEQKDPFQEYQAAHIPGALFFDIDGITDRTSNDGLCPDGIQIFKARSKFPVQIRELPHMLPSEEAFAAAVSALGIKNNDKVIVYDGKGLYSAARVWWMFRVFGHDEVWVLDGGLPQWQASGFDVNSCLSGDAVLKANAANQAVEMVYHGELLSSGTFNVKCQPHLLWMLEKIKENIDAQTHQHLDARSKDRFNGVAPEPRKGTRSGHIPGSKCIPFPQMLDGAHMLLPVDELRKKFEQEGISLDRPIVLSCGSGVTACIVALGLYRMGISDIPVYDGSWIEWEAQPDTTIVTAASCS